MGIIQYLNIIHDRIQSYKQNKNKMYGLDPYILKVLNAKILKLSFPTSAHFW